MTNFINYYDEMTDLVDKSRAGIIVYLDFRKTFNTVPHKVLIKKLMKYRLEEITRWTEN